MLQREMDRGSIQVDAIQRLDGCRLNAQNLAKLKHMVKMAEASQEASLFSVPYENIIEVCNFLRYGNPDRVLWQFYFLTGCRPSEANKMQEEGKMAFRHGLEMWWRVGKNQKGQWRHEPLPLSWWKEYFYMKQVERTYSNRMFPFNNETFLSHFNKEIRPYLSKIFQQKHIAPKRNEVHEYCLQVKGLRKSFSCLIFDDFFQRWKNPEIALEFTSARLHHSTKNITAQFYLRDYERLNMARWSGHTPSEILALAEDKHLPEYDVKMDLREINQANRQSVLIPFLGPPENC